METDKFGVTEEMRAFALGRLRLTRTREMEIADEKAIMAEFGVDLTVAIHAHMQAVANWYVIMSRETNGVEAGVYAYNTRNRLLDLGYSLKAANDAVEVYCGE